MRTRILLSLLVLSAATPAVAAVGAGASGAGWRAGPLVTLTGPVAGLQCANDGEDSAPLVAVDPRSPARVVATYLTDNGQAQVAATSSDGGRSWTRALIAADTSCTGGHSAGLVDPALYVDSSGYAVSSAGWINTAAAPTDVNHDCVHELTMTLAPTGHAFGAPVDVESNEPDQRGYLTELDGRLYLETERFDAVGGQYLPGLGAVAVLESADHGATWHLTGSQPASAPPGHQPVAGGIVAVGSRLVATWADVDIPTAVPSLVTHAPLAATITAAVSDDGGKTWSAPMSIAAGSSTLPRTSSAPDGAALVSWEDEVGNGGVRLARLPAGGTAWTVTTVAPAGHVDYGITSVAAARDGTIAVLHEAAVPGGSGQLFRVVLSTSSDDGASWTATPVSPVMNLATYPNPTTAFDDPYGAEEQVVPAGNGFLAAFPVFRPVPLVDGDSDVAVVRVSRR